MNCCGQKRQQWQQESTLKSEEVFREPVLENPVQLRYNGTDNHLVKGPKTGILYLFAPLEAGLMVDGQDAPMLLADSKKFSLANGTNRHVD
jgi:hypothetical protein